MAYQAEKTLADNKDKITEDYRSEITTKVEALKRPITANDLERMKTASEEVSQALQKAGSHVVRAAGGNSLLRWRTGRGKQGEPSSGDKPDEGTVEANSERSSVKAPFGVII